MDEVARSYWDAGVRHIVALRGDAPSGAERYEPHPDGYAYAADLVAGLKRVAPFEISVAAYPETHPTALSADHDLDNLKRKIDAGATRAITQYFFDTEVFLRFLDRCARGRHHRADRPRHHAGVEFHPDAEILRHVRGRGAGLDGSAVRGAGRRPETRRMVSVVLAAEQVRLLQANGVDEFHFYTLNRPDLVYAIAHILGARPVREPARRPEARAGPATPPGSLGLDQRAHAGRAGR